MKKLLIYKILIAGLLLGVVSCSKDDGDLLPRTRVTPTRTLFIYMGGDDGSLSRVVDNNMDKIISASRMANMRYGKIVIFQDRLNNEPRMLLVEPGKEAGILTEVEVYDKDINTNEKDVLSNAIIRMQEIAPATSYTMLLWSHGSSWLPGNSKPSSLVQYPLQTSDSDGEGVAGDDLPGISPSSVYVDSGLYMDLDTFADALPGGLFDLIIMDECYSGGIEVAWALKDKTDHLILSAAEVDLYGMPYHKIIPHIFAFNPRLDKICEDYYTHYLTLRPNEPSQNLSATTVLVDCRELDTEFASITKDILGLYGNRINELSKISVQKYGRGSYAYAFYDFTDFVKKITPAGDPLLDRFLKKMDEIVTYKIATEDVFGMTIDLGRYSGLTTYIPFPDFKNSNNSYKETAWYKDAYPPDFIN